MNFNTFFSKHMDIEESLILKPSIIELIKRFYLCM